MLFSSVTFLYLFLPVTLILYLLTPKKFKNVTLLLASLFFYWFGERSYTILLFISSVSDWVWSMLIEKYRGKKVTRLFLIFSILINVGLLGYFKYSDFFIGNINSLFGANIPFTEAVLPIGISFYTFQTMSYTIDVYRGKAKAQKNIISFATFVCLFPQLIAGPIVRYTDVAKELDDRRTTLKGFSEGIRRFAMGLGKKVILANGMGELCRDLTSSGDSNVLMYWLYAVGFALQIYLDFSAYSDMAIGLGKMFGFEFAENFNYPFISKSITEFWRRWHMTLGGWFRDYIYFPLGGSRTSTIKWLRNILIVWMVTGLWHGAEWNFVLWGVYFGVLLVVEKLFLGKLLEKCPSPVRHMYVLFTVLVSFVIFSVEKLDNLPVYLGGLFGAGNIPLFQNNTLFIADSFAILLVVCIVASLPVGKMLWKKMEESDNKAVNAVLLVAEPLTIAAMLVLSTALLVDGSYNPFLYFRF